MKTRAYNKVRRAEAEQETRQRIVDALLALHEEVGPARTTVSAVADRAGVERLTVYRHFPDETSMIRACSSCWAERHPFPALRDLRSMEPADAVRATLLDLYGWYRENARMLERIEADRERVTAVREAMEPGDVHFETIATSLDRLWPNRSATRLATLRHAIAFATWQSLARIAGSDRRAVAIVLEWIS